MSFRHFLLGLAVTVMALPWLASPVVAQMPQVPPMKISREGHVVAMTADKIRVATADGQHWMVYLSKKTSVMLTGKADATLLRSGTFIKFKAKVNRRKKVTRPVEAIQIFTPTKQDIFGAFPHQGVGFGTAAKTNQAAERTKRLGKRSKRDGEDAGKDEAGSLYDIVGRIAAVRRATLMVNLGKGSIEIELAKDVQVDLAVADIRFAHRGDQIFFSGRPVGSKSARAVKAVSIQIAHTPLEKKPGKKSSDEPAPATDKDAKGSDEPPSKGNQEEALVNMLTPKRAKASKENFKIKDDVAEFQPCTRQSAASLERRFGKAEQTEVEGILTLRGRDKTSKWHVYSWGSVRVIVDRSRKARFFTLGK